MNTVTRSYPIGGSCPWRIVAPAQMTPIARTLEAARTRPNIRAMLAAEAAKATPPESPSPVPGTILVGGFILEAPGFTPESFDRGMHRAFNDNLELRAIPGAIGRFRVNGYMTDRNTCTCKAGQTNTACKHRAYVIYMMDIAGTAWAEAS